MSEAENPLFTLESLDLAALIASKVCHDVISPVGAIVNGLEVLEDEKDEMMRETAFDLIRKSANQASASLQFCRLAFGAAGSAGSSIDTRDAQNVATNYFSDDRTKIEWLVPPAYLPKNRVKLLLNLVLIATSGIPRGGHIKVEATGAGDETGFVVTAVGPLARIPTNVVDLIAGKPLPETGVVDARAIQPFYTGMLARASSMTIVASLNEDAFQIIAS